MIRGITTELCAGSIRDCLLAERFPIDRIELNCALELGGLTPSNALLQFTKNHTELPVVCMIRPRAAGFVYSETEFELMKLQAQSLLEQGADGIVFGFLRPDHAIDEARTEVLASLAHSYGKEAVFHRAFDEASDPFAACEALIRCGIDRLLTSGQKPSAMEGATLIKELIRMYGCALSILPGAGINAGNVAKLLSVTGARQFHMSAKSMRSDNGLYPATDARNLQAVMQALGTSCDIRKPSLLTREDAAMLQMEPYETALTR